MCFFFFLLIWNRNWYQNAIFYKKYKSRLRINRTPRDCCLVKRLLWKALTDVKMRVNEWKCKCFWNFKVHKILKEMNRIIRMINFVFPGGFDENLAFFPFTQKLILWKGPLFLLIFLKFYILLILLCHYFKINATEWHH